MSLGEIDTATANLVLKHVRKELKLRKGPLTDKLFTELVEVAAQASVSGDTDTERLEAWNRILKTRS